MIQYVAALAAIFVYRFLMLFTLKNIVFIGFMGLVTLGLITLGIWQLQRLEWKLGLIEAAQVNAQAVPVSLLPQDLSIVDMTVQNYQNVQLNGRFQYDYETYVTAVIQTTTGPEDGAGFWVLMPFLLDDKTAILVNTGFVPTSFKNPDTRKQMPLESVQLDGLLRQTQPKGWAILAPDLQEHVFFSHDVEAIVSHLKRRSSELAKLEFATFFVDAKAIVHKAAAHGVADKQNFPLAGLTQVRFTNNHLGYAIVWFLLACAVLNLTLYWLVRRWRDEKKLYHNDGT